MYFLTYFLFSFISLCRMGLPVNTKVHPTMMVMLMGLMAMAVVLMLMVVMTAMATRMMPVLMG